MNRNEENKKAVVDKDFVEAELFEAVSHPTRIQILKTLRRGSLGFAELKHTLGISSSGNLSHHLSKLATFVETSAQGKYELTDQGREALYAIMAIARAGTWRDWMAHTFVFVSALIFYAVFLTASITSGRADALTPLIGLIATVIFSVIFYLLILGTHRARKGMRRAYEDKWMWKWEGD